MVTSFDCFSKQVLTFCLTFFNLISLAYDFFGLCNLTFHDFLHTDNNFLEGKQLSQEGKFMAGVQEADGCNHGGVAVPVAVLFGKKMRQNIPTFTWMRVRFEPVTNWEREKSTKATT